MKPSKARLTVLKDASSTPSPAPEFTDGSGLPDQPRTREQMSGPQKLHGPEERMGTAQLGGGGGDSSKQASKQAARAPGSGHQRDTDGFGGNLTQRRGGREAQEDPAQGQAEDSVPWPAQEGSTSDKH